MAFFRLKIGKMIFIFASIQNPIKIYADQKGEFVYHGFNLQMLYNF